MRLLPLAFAASLLFCAAFPARSFAQDSSLVVTNPIEDFTVAAGTKTSVIKLKDTFSRPAENPASANPIVRFDTVRGTIDVEMLQDDAPATVANFLNYVNRGAYDGSFIHRSVPGFVIQGGGFTFTDNQVNTIPTDPPVVNEFKDSNVRGTLAMAKLGSDPNSATDQWFFNESDSNAGGAMGLDSQNGGFTVFGRVVTNPDGTSPSLNVVDNIAALPITNAGSPFDTLPVINYKEGDSIGESNLVVVRSIAVLPASGGSAGTLTYSLKGNTNPSLVKSVTFLGKKMTLKFKKGLTGSSTITIKAKDVNHEKAKTSFTVTVQ